MNARLRVSSCVCCGSYMHTWVHTHISLCVYLCLCVHNGYTAVCMTEGQVPSMCMRFC